MAVRTQHRKNRSADMSYGHLIAAWKVTGLTPREKVVLLALADCMNATTGMCFPSARRLGEMTGLHDRSVWRVLGLLEEKGLITRINRELDRGGKSSNRYLLHLSEPVPPPTSLPMTEPAQPYEEIYTPPYDKNDIAPMTQQHTPYDKNDTLTIEENHRREPREDNTHAQLFELTETEPTPKPAKAKKRALGEYGEAFEAFWKIYPSNRGKAAAFKAWGKAKKRGATEEQLKTAAAAYAGYVARLNRAEEHIKHASSWLNQDEWLDEPDSYKIKPAAGSFARRAAGTVNALNPNTPPPTQIPATNYYALT
nr:MAG TPA: replisome organizer protein [Caudoviricetes sp.]